MSRIARPFEERWWEKVDVNGPIADLRPDLGPCWPWLGALTSDGAGLFWDGERNTLAHRVGWRIAWGAPPPPRLRLKHFACTRLYCAHPGHVRPQTAVENILGATNVAAWSVGQERCLMGHLFTRENILFVPGGWACRICRKEVEQWRRSSHRPVSEPLPPSPSGGTGSPGTF